MTLNRRRAALSAIIIAAVIGWAGAGVASASNKWDFAGDGVQPASHEVDVTPLSNKWD